MTAVLLWAAATAVVWFAVAAAVGLVLGRVVRVRNRQVPEPADPPDRGPQ